MPPTVDLPETLYAKLQTLGGHLFTVPEVIARLAVAIPTVPPESENREPPGSGQTAIRRGGLGVLAMRAPRERGATVEIAGQRVHAGTVSDLYEQAFRILLNNGRAEALEQLAPYRTSNQRYLFSREPVHPNGKAFFVDVKVGPYHIEAHKNYEQAIKQLAELFARVGVSFEYLG